VLLVALLAEWESRELALFTPGRVPGLGAQRQAQIPTHRLPGFCPGAGGSSMGGSSGRGPRRGGSRTGGFSGRGSLAGGGESGGRGGSSFGRDGSRTGRGAGAAGPGGTGEDMHVVRAAPVPPSPDGGPFGSARRSGGLPRQGARPTWNPDTTPCHVACARPAAGRARGSGSHAPEDSCTGSRSRRDLLPRPGARPSSIGDGNGPDRQGLHAGSPRRVGRPPRR
jgi:hypothetical protein